MTTATDTQLLLFFAGDQNQFCYNVVHVVPIYIYLFRSMVCSVCQAHVRKLGIRDRQSDDNSAHAPEQRPILLEPSLHCQLKNKGHYHVMCV